MAVLLLVSLVGWTGMPAYLVASEHYLQHDGRLHPSTPKAPEHQHPCCPHLTFQSLAQVVPARMPCSSGHSCCVQAPAGSPALPVPSTSSRSSVNRSQAIESSSSVAGLGVTSALFSPDTGPLLQPSLLSTVLRI